MLVKNKKGFYQLEKFLLPELIHGFSTKRFGNMAYKYGRKEGVDKNRLSFASVTGLHPARVVQMSLAHGTTVAVVDRANAGSLTSLEKVMPDTDGLITNASGVALWLLTGDCTPLLFYDPKRRVLGLAHSGWKGTVGKIGVMLVAKMEDLFGSRPEDIIVGVGPSIEKCCYVEDRPAAQESLPEWEEFILREGENKIRFDLNGFTIKQLLEIGIEKENIDCANYCTKDHADEFFCSQQETAGKAKPGRFATVIQMV